MLPTIAQLQSKISSVSRKRLAQQLYLSGFKRNDCDYDKLHLTWATDPLSKDYFSPLNPCFTFEPKTPELLNAHPSWLVRDGALSLVDALISNRFRGIESTLLFNKELQRVLPINMQEQSLYFDLVSTQTEKNKKDKVLIYTLINGAFTSPEHFESALKKARAARPDLQEKDFHILLLLRENQFYQLDSDLVHPAYEFPRIVQKVLPNATLISERNFNTIKDFSSWSFFEVQESCLVIGDSFLKHHILSLKGDYLFSPQVMTDCELIQQSPDHAIRIFGPDLNITTSLLSEAVHVAVTMKKNEKKIKSYWVPPYSKNATFGCFYQWLKEALKDG